MLINCDMGERGIAHPGDMTLMNYIDIANIACGGHSGNRDTVRFYRALAGESDVKISAHLSYPDRAGFGRKPLNISIGELMRSLDEQYSLMDDVPAIKFHGALYNESSIDSILAEQLVRWMESVLIGEIICPGNSLLADLCRKRGIVVLEEAFAERTYTYDRERKTLRLTDRSRDHALIEDVSLALAQVLKIKENHCVSAFIDDGQAAAGREDIALSAQTVCIHSDSSIALELARRLSANG